MGFSEEWDSVYRKGDQLCSWPWSDVVSLVNRFAMIENARILELGCGAGVNIPFLSSLQGSQYCGIEGSSYIVDSLKRKYRNSSNIHIVCGDFTESLCFDGEFDIVIDRSSLTHNVEADISRTVKMIHDKLKPGGIFIGIDWHSTCYTMFRQDTEVHTSLETRSRIYKTGKFSTAGVTHFSEESYLRDLLCCFELVLLREKQFRYLVPSDVTEGAWDFVARKKNIICQMRM